MRVEKFLKYKHTGLHIVSYVLRKRSRRDARPWTWNINFCWWSRLYCRSFALVERWARVTYVHEWFQNLKLCDRKVWRTRSSSICRSSSIWEKRTEKEGERKTLGRRVEGTKGEKGRRCNHAKVQSFQNSISMPRPAISFILDWRNAQLHWIIHLFALLSIPGFLYAPCVLQKLLLINNETWRAIPG